MENKSTLNQNQLEIVTAFKRKIENSNAISSWNNDLWSVFQLLESAVFLYFKRFGIYLFHTRQ